LDQIGGECSTYKKEQKCIQRFDRKRERKRPLGRLGDRREHNIKMELRGMGFKVVE
jgi:hypothetical protein